MTHVKKMMLVPSHTMAPTLLQTPLNASSTETPEKALTRRSINELDTEMERILQNEGLSEGEKLVYSQIPQRCLTYQSQLATPTPILIKLDDPAT